MKVLVIDNYDSFTFNLVQLLGKFKCKIIVKRNDEITLNAIKKLNVNKILISPGPKHPEDSKLSIEIIKELGIKIPILGVCLGHQAIITAFGGKVIKAKSPVHGKVSKIKHDRKTIFNNIPQKFEAMRYHSLIAESISLPDELEISAKTNDELIMAIRHKTFPIEGIQFHPESILTEYGSKIISNWLKL